MRSEQLSSTWLGGKYVLGELLGIGGMGAVYRATQPALERTVAIKFLRPDLGTDPRIVAHFHREALATARVVHPNLVTVLDVGLAGDGRPYLVMEYVAGPRLRELAQGRPLALDRALDLTSQIVLGLDAAHRGGVVHGDVKTENVLVERGPHGDRVKVVDFGLARLRATAEWLGGATLHPGPERGYVSGTPEYMAPEMIRNGEPTPASDLYAVGVILYELVTGTTPFGPGTTVEIMIRHLTEVATPPSLRRPDAGIPPAVDRIVARALAKHPADRYGDAEELAAALELARVACSPGPTTARTHPHATTHPGYLAPLARPRPALAGQRFAAGSPR